MQMISCHGGQLQLLCGGEVASASARTFATGLAPLDALFPRNGLLCGAIHEILAEPGQGWPLFFAALLARSACDRHENKGTIVWCDPDRKLYPPALAAANLPLQRLYLLRPRNAAEELWSIAECLRCRGVAALVASPPRLSRIEARRLQLAAEAGGGVGLLLRRAGSGSAHYAAATRWLARSIPGQRTSQRWELQLIHGHGGQIGKSVILEASRETNHVRAFQPVADRPLEKAVAKKRA